MEYVFIGGSRGIGRYAIEKLTEDGHTVHVFARTDENVSSLPYVNYTEFDVEKGESLPAFENLSGFVYCPGTITLKPVQQLTDDDYKKDFEVNFLHMTRIFKDLLPALKNGKGSAVFFSTVAATCGMPYHASIAAAKGAIEGYMRSVAAELAPDIRCNCIAPSLTDTELGAHLLNSDDKKKAMSSKHPLSRYGTVDDIGESLLYLLSQKSAWMTGQVLHVDGGLSSLRKDVS